MVGVVGAFVAGFLLPAIGVAFASGIVGAIIHATIGAIVVLLLLKIFKR